MVIFVNSLITTSNSNVLPKKRKSKKSKRYEDDLEDVSDFSSKRAKQHNYDSFDEDPDFLGQIQTETAVSPLKTNTKNSSSPKPKRTTSKKLKAPKTSKAEKNRLLQKAAIKAQQIQAKEMLLASCFKREVSSVAMPVKTALEDPVDPPDWQEELNLTPPESLEITDNEDSQEMNNVIGKRRDIQEGEDIQKQIRQLKEKLGIQLEIKIVYKT